MYNCTLRIGIIGADSLLESSLRAVPARERFTHVFAVSPSPNLAEQGQDDVIFLAARHAACLPRVREGAKPGAVIVLVTHAEAAFKLSDEDWRHMDDLWAGPHSPASLSIRFGRLLDAVKQRRDFHLARYCLDTVINATPSLIWFKDAKGAHLKVNDSFCRTVGKTKPDIEGRGHYYIWDLKKEEYEKGEYVCLETDTIVMEEGKTRVFDEFVKSKQGMRQFKTWKAPLFDDDGTVMGTVGVAHDVTNLATMSAELELLLGSLPFAVLITDAEERIVNVNEKFREFFSLSDEQVLGCTAAEWKDKIQADQQLGTVDGRMELTLEVSGKKVTMEVQRRDILDIFSNKIGAIVIFRDVTLEREFERQLSHNANTDALTGLYNRRFFYEHVQAHRGTSGEGLLYVDLDNFKSINDHYGHQMGDEILALAARLLREACPEAVAARLGGDEFVLYLNEGCSLELLEQKARVLLEKLCEAFQHSQVVEIISASIGIVYAEEPDLTLDALIRRADMAMYEAKRIGKICCCVYTPELEARQSEGRATGWKPGTRSAARAGSRGKP